MTHSIGHGEERQAPDLRTTSGGSLAEGAFDRESRLLLRRLDRPGVRLLRRGPEWCIEAREAGRGRRPKPVEPRLVEVMSARGLIESDGPGYRIAEAGRGRLAASGAGGDAGRPVRIRAESPLAWLRGRKDAGGLDAAEFDAGERLRRDYTDACLEARLTVSWDIAASAGRRPAPRAEGLTVTERALAARRRYHLALDAVGPELASVLVEVCCLAAGIEAAERRLGWPRRSGKVVLKLALAALARHYGLSRPAAPRQPALRHWGAADYRPKIAESEDLRAAKRQAVDRPPGN